MLVCFNDILNITTQVDFIKKNYNIADCKVHSLKCDYKSYGTKGCIDRHNIYPVRYMGSEL